MQIANVFLGAHADRIHFFRSPPRPGSYVAIGAGYDSLLNEEALALETCIHLINIYIYQTNFL